MDRRNDRFDSGTTQVYLGSRMPARVQVTTDKTSLLGSMARLYDGDPQEGSTLIAEHWVLPGLLGSSGYVAWFQYNLKGLDAAPDPLPQPVADPDLPD